MYVDYEEAGHRTAAVCLNGHVATNSVETSPELAGKFCAECGVRIIQKCSHCGSKLRGDYYVPGVIDLTDSYRPPNFCVDCGDPFPWFQEKLAAAGELADEAFAGEDERARVKESLVAITKDTPRSAAAAIRLKKMVGATGDAVGRALWKAAIDIATEAAKKTMLGG